MSELDNAVWQEKVGRFYAVLVHDQDASSPDDWDSGTNLVTWDRHGPGQDVSEPDRDCREDDEGYTYEPDKLTWGDFMRAVDPDAMLMLPIRFNDYGSSGATIHVVDLDRAWDDATGAIYMTERDIRDGWLLSADAPITADVVQNAIDNLTAQVETWAQYCRGEVYGALVVDEEGQIVHEVDGQFIESLWSIYDSYPYSYAKGEALNFAQDAEGLAAAADAEDATHGAPMFVIV